MQTMRNILSNLLSQSYESPFLDLLSTKPYQSFKAPYKMLILTCLHKFGKLKLHRKENHSETVFQTGQGVTVFQEVGPCCVKIDPTSKYSDH